MSHDARVKRAVLIGQSVEVRDSFSFASPTSVLRALQVYCTSYYGSLASWDLGSQEVTQFYGVWRLNVLLTHNLPRATHRYFLPMLAPGAVSAKAEIMSRFVTFFRSLRWAPSHEIRTAALLADRDMRSTLGRNISLVEEETGQDAWTVSSKLVRAVMMEKETVTPTPRDEWRLPYLTRLMEERELLKTEGRKEEQERIQELIDCLCTT